MKEIETNNCKINYSESLQNLAENTVILIDKKIHEYRLFFELPIIEKITVNYFDNIKDFRNFIYKIRGEKDSLPEYAIGTYDKEMVNAYVNSSSQLENLYTASHELFHILYLKYILNSDYSKRIVWFDEGMAQFMSGEKDFLNDNEKFKEFYLQVKKNTKVIPRLNNLEHGDSFANENYNGYDLSYLAIKYLSETLNICELKKIMANFSKINLLGENILQCMFNYYDIKLKKATNPVIR